MSTIEGSTTPTWRGAAAIVCTLAWALVLTSVVLGLVFRPDADALTYELHAGFYPTDAVIATVYGPVSAMLLARTRHLVGWVLALVAVGFGLAALALMYGMIGAQHPDLPALGLVVHLVTWVWVAGGFALLLVVPWVLLEDRPRPLQRAAAWIGGLITAAACLSRAVDQLPGAPENPLALSGRAAEVADLVSGWSIGVAGGFGLLAVAYLARRTWGAPPAERRGLGWMVAGLLLVLLSYVAFQLGLLQGGGPLLPVSAGVLFAGQTLLPVALLALVLRQRLWGLEVAVSRAAMWGLLTAVVLAVYGMLVWLGSQVLPLERAVSGSIAAASLALGVQPLRHVLQRRVDQLVYGAAHDPGLLLERMGTDLVGDAPGQSGLQRLTDGLRRNLRLGFVEVRSVAEVGSDSQVAAAAGSASGPAMDLALLGQRGQLGWLRVGALRGQRLDQRTLRLLENVAGMVAVALELAQVNAALEATRERLVDVRHAERRMLRRELHDGLGPALAGIGLGLAAVANLVPVERREVQDLLVQMREELNRRTEDVRGMARTLLPPALDDGMLELALRQLAARFTTTRLQVTVEAAEADTLDSRHQIAVYHIVAEAVLNVSRHANATRCDVRCSRDGDVVQLTVHDDGDGLTTDVQQGVGLRSMRERATELGGTCEVRSRALVPAGVARTDATPAHGPEVPDLGSGTEIVVRLP